MNTGDESRAIFLMDASSTLFPFLFTNSIGNLPTAPNRFEGKSLTLCITQFRMFTVDFQILNIQQTFLLLEKVLE